MDITIPQTEDIYTLGFDKNLSKVGEGSMIADSISDRIETSQIVQGDLSLTSLSVANKGIIAQGDTQKGLQVGNVLSASNFLAPFDVANDGKGTIRRVGRIQFASASDLGVSSIEPGASNKTIWANGNDLRYNAIGSSGVHQFYSGLDETVRLDAFGEFCFGSRKTSLTNSAVNTIIQIALTSNTYTGGTLRWTVVASDGADFQTRTGITTWAAVNVGGVYTTDVDEIGGSVANSTGTLTGVWSIVTGTNLINLKFTPTSSLTPTTLNIFYTYESLNGQAVTRL